MTGAFDILIPCKGFSRGKSRLAGTISSENRYALCRAFLLNTLDVAAGVRGKRCIAVVTEDDEVRAIAKSAGATILDDPGGGASAAVAAANKTLAAMAPSPGGLLVLPADLPLATAASLEDIVQAAGQIVIAPDRAGTGTNAMFFRSMARAGFPFSFGPDSLNRHLDSAARSGHSVALVKDKRLGLDIDEPADLATLSSSPLSPPIVRYLALTAMAHSRKDVPTTLRRAGGGHGAI